jgi:putative membrane protein
MMWWYGVGGWDYLLMATNAVLFGALVIVAVIVLLRYLDRRESDRAKSLAWRNRDPRRELARRFAAGEIDEDEFRRRHAILDSERRSTPIR